MMVSRSFLKDFAYIANYYDWSEETIEEVKQSTRDNPSLVRYWEILAAAHRSGYKQTENNNYIRLRQWAKENLIRDPFLADFDVNEFKAIIEREQNVKI